MALVTGEESETTAHELKNVKLYIKRAGSKDFSDGMPGSVKVLVNREDSTQTRIGRLFLLMDLRRNAYNERRLVFRRDPLFQVTMNVRLDSRRGVRCTFDESEGVLRVIKVEADGGVVVYALKVSMLHLTAFQTSHHTSGWSIGV